MYCKIPNGVDRNDDWQWLDQRHRSRHERVNNKFKEIDGMNDKFWHSMENHRDCFNRVAVLSQFSMDNGGAGLFPVVYDDTIDDFDEAAENFWVNN